ncbi:HNH endonuclease [Massilia endophytica]|uniref:HNH endonuclease n=1 Tax=Massilia endophytica TaxID=2899220 RepID=UPI001E4249A7|nr:HNH endonuclease signature motif containing protein [Massilia endophytica]UGQ49310.1 HNH endonuclease [Massilia endophytica]
MEDSGDGGNAGTHTTNVDNTNAVLNARRFWWVNQNQTYQFEIGGHYLWSPKTKSNGHRNPFYDFMCEVSAGDLVFSFCDTRIRAIGIATAPAQTSVKPNFGSAGANWAEEGWLIPVEFAELANVVRPKDHIVTLRPLLPEKYSPLQRNGNGYQSVYLTRIDHTLANAVIELIGPSYASTLRLLEGAVDWIELAADRVEAAIKGRTDIGVTEKEQLVKSRRGQGLFKANVRLNEKSCRVTGITDPRHLRASHIKPWKDSTDEEKLNGCNGLLLAPHVDHLFDRGLLSFRSNGDMLVSPRLDRTILRKWNINETQNVGKFNSEQAYFLDYHSQLVLR